MLQMKCILINLNLLCIYIIVYMSNFFKSAANDLGGLEDRILGESFSYSDHIKAPNEIGMSGDGNSIASNVHGLEAYVELLFQGGGKASAISGPMGKQFFLKTGANCRDVKTGEQVTRSLYINNIPVENSTLSQGMTLIFRRAQGLIPGILNNISNINPLGIFGAFMAGSNPDCMAVTLPTRNAQGVLSDETSYVTVNDVKNISPCLFSDRLNPITGKGASCMEGFNSKNHLNDKQLINDIEILKKYLNKNNSNNEVITDIIAYTYFISLTLLFIYLLKK